MAKINWCHTQHTSCLPTEGEKSVFFSLGHNAAEAVQNFKSFPEHHSKCSTEFPSLLEDDGIIS